MSFRVIDGGMVPWLDSQVIYHAVASAMSGTNEPTLRNGTGMQRVASRAQAICLQKE
jgi:hypothetical protein